ncbi:MAG: ATP-binding protein [Acidobacteria bacterium]|nr:ATP-binding protein [Acidobacteriota bacterium]
MYSRRTEAAVRDRLRAAPAVVLLGARQIGKTTLALTLGASLGPDASVYLDLEALADREKLLPDPTSFLAANEHKLVILDEVQRMPELFAALRGLIDAGRRRGRTTGRFLLLGSASNVLLQQSESLAGRIAYVEMQGLDVLEVPATQHADLWARGGFPESLLASSAAASLNWRRDFIRTYLERDIPQLGPRIPATTLHRFWTMLAHVQGGLLNAAQLARGLDVDGKTIARYMDLMVDLMLVRRLMPFHVNAGKRLVRSPKVYVRDSGLVHALLGIPDRDALFGHPVQGDSWEGFVIENLLGATPPLTVPAFYRTAVGAEIDLFLDIPGHGRWAIEVKYGTGSRPAKGFFIACGDVKPDRRFLVNSGTERYPIGQGVEVIGLPELAAMLVAIGAETPPEVHAAAS